MHKPLVRIIETRLAGILPPNVEEAFDKHLEGCEVCRAKMEEIKKQNQAISAAMQKALNVPMPDTLDHKLRKLIQEHTQIEPNRAASAAPGKRRFYIPAAAAAIFVASLSFYTWSRTSFQMEGCSPSGSAVGCQNGRLITDSYEITTGKKQKFNQVAADALDFDSGGIMVSSHSENTELSGLLSLRYRLARLTGEPAITINGRLITLLGTQIFYTKQGEKSYILVLKGRIALQTGSGSRRFDSGQLVTVPPGEEPVASTPAELPEGETDPDILTSIIQKVTGIFEEEEPAPPQGEPKAELTPQQVLQKLKAGNLSEAQVRELLKKLPQVDRLILKDEQILTGKVIAETPAKLTIITPLGKIDVQKSSIHNRKAIDGKGAFK